MNKKNFIVLILCTFLTIALLSPIHENLSIISEAIASEQKLQVLLLIRHGVSRDTDLMLKEEVGVMTNMLEEAGFTVIVASDSGELIEGQTLNLKPHLKYADVKVNNYVGIIIPCMAKGSSLPASAEEVSIVKQAVAQRKPIAAQRNAVIILAESGALTGKKYTTKSSLQYRDSFADAIYSDKEVSQDGKIMTSKYCPYAARYYKVDDGTSELTKLFILAIKEQPR